MNAPGPNKKNRPKKGMILGGILAVLVISIGMFVFGGMMNHPTMTEAERDQAMDELSAWAQEKKQSAPHIVFAGPEDIYQFIADYEMISGHQLDYDKNVSGSVATLYDGVCRMDVVNYNTNARGNFQVTIKFEGTGRDEYYQSAIQTILRVFGMKDQDVRYLTDHFVSDNSFRYTFDESFVSQNYHDDLRVSFQTTQKRPGKMSTMLHGKIEITSYHYPARDQTDAQE